MLIKETLNLYTVKENDSLYIPESNNVVYVYGETSIEGAVMFSENQTLDYYLNRVEHALANTHSQSFCQIRNINLLTRLQI